jgi:shikimate kinase
MNDTTRAMVLANGLSVWLKADLEVLWTRVSKRDSRPLLKTANPKQTLSDLLDQRYPVYAKADVTVQSRDDDKDIIAAETVMAVAQLDGGQETVPDQ